MTAALYSGTLLLSGALLFLVQPMFARMVLPLVGGAPAVWNTVMVCYQVLLLAGYLYAHATSRWLQLPRQVAVHVGLLVLPLLVLPIALPGGSAPPAGGNPSWWVMATLLMSAGLPFFVVTTTSPLVQSWFATLQRDRATNPYALYAASNTGSMLGLLGYPLWLEPRLTLREQSALWAVGFGLLMMLVIACGLLAHRTTATATSTAVRTVRSVTAPAPLPWRRRLRWIVLAFIPSSLMLSVTMHLSTNIAPMPWLWVLPLALYLLTFIVAFSARATQLLPFVSRALPMAIVPVMVAILADVSKPVWVSVALHAVSFTVIALHSHLALAADAPGAEHLTEFYLWLSVGGALGGVFNALVAPALFTSVLEYPLVLVLAAFVLAVDRDDTPAPRTARGITPARVIEIAWPLTLVPLVVVCDIVTRQLGLESVTARRILALGTPAIICYVLAGRQLRFGLGVASLLAGSATFERTRQLLVAERSYFGITRVYVTGGGSYHALVHGSISHGAQSLDPARRREPLSYYTKSGPVGEIIIPRQRLGLTHQVAVVGLGAGSLACYCAPGERWTFFEIDAAVLRIAQDPRFFSYLRDCAPEASVVLGDARQSLATVPDGVYDLMLMDAYSADAIPMHLLTREAFALYERKLAPGGVIAFHISNQYFALAPVIAALAYDIGMVTRFRDEEFLTESEVARGKTTSDWIVVARRAADFGPLLALPRWEAVRPAPRVWTDDYSSAINALR